MDRMPTTAINAAMLADPKPITCLKYRKKLEYWPASGRYENNTVMQIGRTVGSFLTFFRDCKTKEQGRY